jgi:hypothetical protein
VTDESFVLVSFRVAQVVVEMGEGHFLEKGGDCRHAQQGQCGRIRSPGNRQENPVPRLVFGKETGQVPQKRFLN